MQNVRAQSNGESAFRFFTEHIKENALYLLDEPENSLAADLQLQLSQFIADTARFYHCQFIIATHSPFLLAMEHCRIYDLDAIPVTVKPWTFHVKYKGAQAPPACAENMVFIVNNSDNQLFFEITNVFAALRPSCPIICAEFWQR